ncbi:UDP-N-acetylmuramoyl-L-alanine--D-glutamate ligase [Catenovulum sp. SM1970]|uniref:UDP-N-acetylmuramoyl-L-alanine--D-glutamate ligase n=1 Tax=Marinifaba aquimaris TaxID=2741323 RepID=UPI0015729604|nr:UDP-N-acetylmuramoyl-L-alanine--D-glutamate ligase [Marinifaba aquimaris]NTS76589.1 UDP-N-acetylmuramoyl-L-alanine--D-glutamate ligase [Marinifaba aquimaris]
MNWFHDNQHKQFGILGLGLSGQSCLRFLLAQNIEPDVFDTRENLANLDEIYQQLNQERVHLGELDFNTLSKLDYLVMSPGLDPRGPIFDKLLANGVQLINEIELFAHACDKQIIAITGSNGKSTVTSLLGHVFEQAHQSAAIGGNIGIPALTLLLDKPDADFYVLELSSFQLEFCPSFRANVSLLLNISEDHLDRYTDIAEYALVKRRIFNGADLIVYNRDDDSTFPVKDELAKDYKQATHFGLSSAEGADWYIVSQQAISKSGVNYSLSQTSLVGKHNQANMLAVLAVADFYQLEQQSVEHALTNYQGLAHRCQLVSRKLDCLWIDDSKATNVGATLAALQGLAENKNIILLAGGVGKGADFTPLQPAFEKSVKQLITFGRDGGQIANLIDGAIEVDGLETAVKIAKGHIVPGDIVLLSPACASLDMFKNFEQRGLAFQHAVEALS